LLYSALTVVLYIFSVGAPRRRPFTHWRFG